MITAIPMNDDRVANHFTKANCLVFLDERGIEINRVDNPALAEGCAGKQKMVDLLAEQQVDRVVVRNIGEQMLGKLLARQFAVYQTNCGRRSAHELVDPIASGLLQLHQASQGRQSLNHEAKAKSGGCGCHHPEESIQTLAVTLPIPLAKKWLLANGIRCVDKIVVAAARVVADAANPKSMGVADIVHLAELYGCLVAVLAPTSSQAETGIVTRG